ncbi:MAG: hypothetical protein EBS91_03995 [Betaproteobacteria bacterium]|nr:hypothetical protein [Betaproteobacteria bacterium]
MVFRLWFASTRWFRVDVDAVVSPRAHAAAFARPRALALMPARVRVRTDVHQHEPQFTRAQWARGRQDGQHQLHAVARDAIGHHVNEGAACVAVSGAVHG